MILERISQYLQLGGLFNPELMDHAKVRDMIIACRDHIEALEVERDKQREHIRAQAEDIMTLGHLVYDDAAPPATWKMRALTAEADKARLSEALRSTLASLVAAVSLLKRGSKKAAPSNKMFDQMILDYEKSIEEARAALSGSGSGWRDIASAPHDGTVVLVFSTDAQSPRVQAAWWHDGWWRSYKPTLDKFETENPFRWFPTHWMPMPLPAAPQQGGE